MIFSLRRLSFLAGVNSLCQALCANPAVASALTHLDLSGNSLRGDDLQVLSRRASFCLIQDWDNIIQRRASSRKFNTSLFCAQNLHSFLSHSNCLETLDLSNSDCSLEQVKAAHTHTCKHTHSSGSATNHETHASDRIIFQINKKE